MKKEMIYGRKVDFYTVLCTEKRVSVFLPMKFPWEKQGEKTLISLSSDYQIIGNTGAKLLIATGSGIREVAIPFEKKGKNLCCNLPKFLKTLDIPYERANGTACDGSTWKQEDYTSEVLYCKDGMLEHLNSPYWGGQYEMHFANKEIRPETGGRAVEILRLNFCEAKDWDNVEQWFRYLLKKKRKLRPYDFARILRSAGQDRLHLFVKMKKGGYDWVDFKRKVS